MTRAHGQIGNMLFFISAAHHFECAWAQPCKLGAQTNLSLRAKTQQNSVALACPTDINSPLVARTLPSIWAPSSGRQWLAMVRPIDVCGPVATSKIMIPPGDLMNHLRTKLGPCLPMASPELPRQHQVPHEASTGATLLAIMASSPPSGCQWLAGLTVGAKGVSADPGLLRVPFFGNVTFWQ